MDETEETVPRDRKVSTLCKVDLHIYKPYYLWSWPGNNIAEKWICIWWRHRSVLVFNVNVMLRKSKLQFTNCWRALAKQHIFLHWDLRLFMDFFHVLANFPPQSKLSKAPMIARNCKHWARAVCLAALHANPFITLDSLDPHWSYYNPTSFDATRRRQEVNLICMCDVFWTILRFQSTMCLK